MKKTSLVMMALIFSSLMALASDPKMLHVDIRVQEEEGGEPISVQLNFPLSMIQTMAPNINEALQNVEAENKDVDLRAIWRDVRAAGPNEFVNVNKADTHIRVSTTETQVMIDIDSVSEGTIKVTMPLALGDLILGSNPNVTVEQVLASLENWQGDLVTISGDKVNGHVWID